MQLLLSPGWFPGHLPSLASPSLPPSLPGSGSPNNPVVCPQVLWAASPSLELWGSISPCHGAPGWSLSSGLARGFAYILDKGF